MKKIFQNEPIHGFIITDSLDMCILNFFLKKSWFYKVNLLL